MELNAGTTVDRYVVDRVLGEGGMAIVYLCRHTQLGTWHALKVLTIGSRAIRERLVQEGQVQAKLRHPNVVSVTDILTVNGAPGLLMEFIEGPSLDQLMDQRRLSLDEIDVIAEGLLAGIGHAHAMGMIHRDLKPANIMLEQEGGRWVPKIMDFGLAKLVDGDQLNAATRTGMAMGTPQYMSPEQVNDSKSVDHRTDLFACGAILYEMVTGHRAFAGDSMFQIFGAVASGRFRDPAELRPDIPKRMREAILWALNIDRDARCSSAADLLYRWQGDPVGWQAPAAAPRVRAPHPPRFDGDALSLVPTPSGPLHNPNHTVSFGDNQPDPRSTDGAATDARTFHIERCLGRGGFGEVYLATMSSPGGVRSQVAVKVLREDVDPATQAVQRLRDEARLLGELDHPAILNAFDLVTLEGRVAMLSEYVAGADLDTCLSTDDPPPTRAVLELLGTVAAALDTGWNARGPDGRQLCMLHRDIKPSNIRVGTHGQVKVLDFGIAKFDSRREARTQTDQVMGTLSYMPPERLDTGDNHPSGDVYALGAVLFEALAGHRLWAAKSHQEQVRCAIIPEQHDDWIAASLRGLAPPPAIRELLERCLSHDPDLRPTSAQLAAELEELAERTPGLTLKRWARQQDWTSPPPGAGPWVGRTLTEGPAPAGTSPSEASTPPKRPDAADDGDAAHTPDQADTLQPSADDSFESLPSPWRSRSAKAAMVLIAAGVTLLGGMAVGGSAALTAWSVHGKAQPAAVVSAPDSAGPQATAPTAPPAPNAQPGAKPEPSVLAEPRADAPQAEGVPAGAAVTVSHTQDPPPRPAPPPPTAGDAVTDANHGEAGGADNRVAASIDRLTVAAGELPTAEAPAPAPATATAAPPSPCDEPEEHEPTALLGRLAADAATCLWQQAERVDTAMTARRAAAKVVVADAFARCQRGAGCGDYERTQRYYFEELDQSDPLMMLGWARHLYHGSKSGDRFAEAHRWAGRAMQRADIWSGAERTKRLRELHQIRAYAATRLLEASPQDDASRQRARDAAVAWAELLRALNLDASEAVQLCIGAVGDPSICDKRISTEAIKESIHFASLPMRGEVWVDGQHKGNAPIAVQLEHGTHQIEIRIGDQVGRTQIQVGPSQPTRWRWTAAEGAWTSQL